MMGGDAEGLRLPHRSVDFGRYQLCAKLGSGGQAEVFLAVLRAPAGFSKLAVLKRLRSLDCEDSPQVSMFLDEARVAVRLKHPNVVHTYEIGEQAGEYFIAMEYLEGQPLNKVRRSANEAFTPVMWARIVSEALAGLHHAHELTDYDGTSLGIVHRDISPHNIFVTYDGQVKIVDFGVAKARLNSVQTETGAIKGKVSYMAPEHVLGHADRRSDLFSMGLVLWEVLSGKKLFSGDQVQVLHRIVSDPMPHITSVCPNIDPRLAAIVTRSLEKDPDQRFQTAEEMREALEEFIRGSGSVVRDAQIGAALCQLFAAKREQERRHVQDAMARVALATSTSELAAITLGSSPPAGEHSGATPSDVSGPTLVSVPAAALLPQSHPPSARHSQPPSARHSQPPSARPHASVGPVPYGVSTGSGLDAGSSLKSFGFGEPTRSSRLWMWIAAAAVGAIILVLLAWIARGRLGTASTAQAAPAAVTTVEEGKGSKAIADGNRPHDGEGQGSARADDRTAAPPAIDGQTPRQNPHRTAAPQAPRANAIVPPAIPPTPNTATQPKISVPAETPTNAATTTGPKVRVLEDDPKARIRVIPD